MKKIFFALLAILFFQPALAGGRNTCTDGTISAPVMVYDKNLDGLPNFNDTVTFDVSTSCTDYPFITLRCYQNGVVVAAESNNMVHGFSLGWDFTLGPSPAWPSGAADCIASLENWDTYYKRGSRGIKVITTMSFHVYP